MSKYNKKFKDRLAARRHALDRLRGKVSATKETEVLAPAVEAVKEVVEESLEELVAEVVKEEKPKKKPKQSRTKTFFTRKKKSKD